MIIKGVREEKSKSGKDMIVVAFDFDKTDIQPGYFTDLFGEGYPAWRRSGRMPAHSTSSPPYARQASTSKSFKSFITSFGKV